MEQKQTLAGFQFKYTVYFQPVAPLFQKLMSAKFRNIILIYIFGILSTSDKHYLPGTGRLQKSI